MRISFGTLLVGLSAALVGCHATQDEATMVYIDPVLAHDVPERPGTVPDLTGYTIVEARPSIGRFPGALAVARIEPPGPFRITDDPTRGSWRVGTLKEEEATHWNALFNTIPFVREVIVLDKRMVMWPDAGEAEINASAERLNADLCLIYGPSAAAPNHAGLGGVILDARTAEPVAYVQAHAGPADREPPSPYRYHTDLRHADPHQLVVRKFEWEVRKCIAELAARDQPPPTTLPSDWRERALEHRERSIYLLPSRDIRW